MPTKHDFHKVIIGRSELLSFSDLALHAIPAKADTGAYRSAVHASNIELDASSGVLSFDLLAGHPVCGKQVASVKTTEFQQVIVENSFGHAEERFLVKLKVKLGPKVFSSNFTLANRSKKVFPILLGRKLISHRFLIDPSKTSIDRAALKQQYGIDFPVDEEEGRTQSESILVSEYQAGQVIK